MRPASRCTSRSSGLPILLHAFATLRDQIPVRLTLVGARTDDVTTVLDDLTGIEALGQVDDARKRRVLCDADVLCAPRWAASRSAWS